MNASFEAGRAIAATTYWTASCRYCGCAVVETSRIRDHDVTLMRRHLHTCRPNAAANVYGVMSVVRRHFSIDASVAAPCTPLRH